MDPNEIAKYYELLEKRVSGNERSVQTLGLEVDRLRTGHTAVRDSTERLTSALLGSSALGLEGMLQRTATLEERIKQLENQITQQITHLIRFIVLSHLMMFLMLGGLLFLGWKYAVGF